MRKCLVHAIGLVGLGSLVVSCSGGPNATPGAAPSSPRASDHSVELYDTSTRPSPSGSAHPTQGVAHARVKVASSTTGMILVDGEGHTLYLFEKDKDGTSDCYGACAAAWPPYLTEGAPEAGDGAKADLMGTAERTDGKTQVAYAGRPLYYYTGDQTPGDIAGNRQNGFGGDWYAVMPDGTNA
jgi:predicted lipoprotein with Yx(FWY)xxD motif